RTPLFGTIVSAQWAGWGGRANDLGAIERYAGPWDADGCPCHRPCEFADAAAQLASRGTTTTATLQTYDRAAAWDRCAALLLSVWRTVLSWHPGRTPTDRETARSEEHTSELQ